MAEYLIDASIMIQEFVDDHYTQEVRRLFAGLAEEDKLYIPTICLVECTNVLWKRVRFNAMPEVEAEFLLRELLELPLMIVSIDDVLPRALQIGLTHKLAIYDSVYIALAAYYKFPLITADAKQETAARTVGVTIKPITDF